MREPTSTEKAHPAAPQGKPCTKDAAGEASGDGTSRDLSLLVARTLRIGVALAGLIALAGGIGYLWRHGSETLPDLSHFSYNALPENAEGFSEEPVNLDELQRSTDTGNAASSGNGR